MDGKVVSIDPVKVLIDDDSFAYEWLFVEHAQAQASTMVGKWQYSSGEFTITKRDGGYLYQDGAFFGALRNVGLNQYEVKLKKDGIVLASLRAKYDPQSDKMHCELCLKG